MPPIHSQLLDLLRTAKRIAVLTGAGVSAESGIPTFRDAMTGLWATFDPAELATPQAFARNPAMVSRWYDERRCSVARCRPNAGHMALATLQNRCIADGRQFTLITQNVDRLHQAAGSTNVIELHGTLWVWRCIDCGEESEERGPAFAAYPPRCSCGGDKRPGVVWFGEELPKHALLQAQRTAASCTLFLSLGTSSVVYPAAGLIDLALKNGANTLEINPEETAYSRKMHWSIRGKSGEILPQLLAAAFNIATEPARGDISYDLVMDDDMSFVEGTFRIEHGAWEVFIFLTKNDLCEEPHWQRSTWENGVTGFVFNVPKELRLNKRSVTQLLSRAAGVGKWSEIQGPDSMKLR